MVKNADAPPPTRTQAISRAAAHHSEELALIVGIILGASIALLGVLVGG